MKVNQNVLSFHKTREDWFIDCVLNSFKVQGQMFEACSINKNRILCGGGYVFYSSKKIF